MAKGVDFRESNLVMQGPAGREDVYDLPVWTDGERTIACFELSEAERAEVARTGRVWVWLMTPRMPPVAIETKHPFRAEGT